MLPRHVSSVCKSHKLLQRLSGAHSKSAIKSFTNSAEKLTTTPYHETLTLLHKTTSLLPQVLTSKAQTNCPHPTESCEFWNDILSNVHEDLSSTTDRPARIAVLGIGNWSGAHDLITALLEEPLGSDESQNEQIRNRWVSRADSENLTISYGTSSSTPTMLQIRSPYLLRFHIPLEITELSPTSLHKSHDDFSAYFLDENASQALLKSDVSIIVCNPLTTPLSPLLHSPLLRASSKTILALTYTTPPPDFTNELLPYFTLDKDPSKPPLECKVLFIDPRRAVEATAHFKADPRSPTVIQQYQNEYMGSRISTFTSALEAILTADLKTSRNSFQIRTSLTQLNSALSTCTTSLKNAKNEMQKVSAAISRLNGRIEEEKAKAQKEVLGQAEGVVPPKSNIEEDRVGAALREARKDMQIVMDSLTWWRMVWRVDEISNIVSQAMENAWCRNLEKELIIQTGRLSALQCNITNYTFAILSAQSTPPFNSAVLHNSLKQLISSPSYKLTPQTLISPISTRKHQIIEHPTTRLHLAGQRAVLGMTGGLLSGTGLGWAGWVGWLSGSGEGLLGLIGMDAGTAMGMGALWTIIGIRWAVGSWERSKRRWWEDWTRVCSGLNRDLAGALDHVMEKNILIVGATASSSLSDIVMKRKGGIKDIEVKLESLYKDMHQLEGQAVGASPP